MEKSYCWFLSKIFWGYMNKSIIVDHPFWNRIKAKKGIIDPMTKLPIKEFILPTKKYWEFLKRLLKKD